MTLQHAGWMLWETLWALALGLLLSAGLRVFCRQQSVADKFGQTNLKSVSLATVLGAASSSCSYAASAAGRTAFQKGAALVPVLAFMFASTNLVFELALLLWRLLGWEFVLAEAVGAVVLIGLMWGLVKLTYPESLIEPARTHGPAETHSCCGGGSEEPEEAAMQPATEMGCCGHAAEKADAPMMKSGGCSHAEPAAEEEHDHEHEHGGYCHPAGNEPAKMDAAETMKSESHGCGCHGDEVEPGFREKLRDPAKWRELAAAFAADARMLWKELLIGFLIAGLLMTVVPDTWWRNFFITSGPTWLRVVENAIAGPIVAVASFVCSCGNIPLAGVLWTGGISFGGVIAFIYADLLAFPLLVLYRKYYGTKLALYLAGVMFVSVVLAGIIVDCLFTALHWVPEVRTVAACHMEAGQGSLLTLVLNGVALVVGGSLWWLGRSPGKKSGGCCGH